MRHCRHVPLLHKRQQQIPIFLKRCLPMIAFGYGAFVPLVSQGQTASVYGQDFVKATFSVETVLAPAPTAAFSNYVFQPSGFGSGAEALGYHYGVSLADNVSGKFLRKFAFAAVSHREDQYCPIGAARNWPTRLRNAALHTVFAVPQTSRVFNWSGLPASMAAAALSNAYQPAPQRTWAATFQRFGTNAAGYLASDVIAEVTFKPKPNPVFRALFRPRGSW